MHVYLSKDKLERGSKSIIKKKSLHEKKDYSNTRSDGM